MLFREILKHNPYHDSLGRFTSGTGGKITSYSTGASSDEVYMRSDMKVDGKLAGYVEYSVYDNTPHIQYIHTEDDFARQGVATKLMQDLQRQFPDKEIQWGMTTPDGTKLKEKITYEVKDQKVSEQMQKLKSLKEEMTQNESALERLYEKVDSGTLTDADHAKMTKLGERWDQLDAEIFDLENQLKGKKESKLMVKMPVSKSFYEILKFNPNHDDLGRFSSGGGGSAKRFTEDQVKDAIERFTSSQYPKIRIASTGGKVSHTKFDLKTKQRTEIDDTERYKGYADAIEQYIDDQPVFRQPLYRAITVDDATLQSYKVGDTIDQKGISSWSTEEKSTRMFGAETPKTPNRVVFVEREGTNKGRSADKYTLGKLEYEVIQSGKNKQIIEHIESRNGTTYIHVKESAPNVQKTSQAVLKFNQNHDELGRFSSANGTAGGDFKIYDDYSSSVVDDQPQISYEERVKSYSQKEALANYTSGHGLLSYENINDYLNGKKEFSAEERKQLDKNIAEIDSCIKGKTDKDIMVYRGIAADINDIEVGDEITNKGYTSTATSKGIADDFANYYEGTTISVRVPKGTAALFIGYNTAGDFDETEMLFGRNAKITIVGKKGNEVIGELSYV